MTPDHCPRSSNGKHVWMPANAEIGPVKPYCRFCFQDDDSPGPVGDEAETEDVSWLRIVLWLIAGGSVVLVLLYGYSKGVL